MTPPRGDGRAFVASVKWTSLTEMLTRQLRRPRRGPLRPSVGARVSPLSRPQSFTNLRQA